MVAKIAVRPVNQWEDIREHERRIEALKHYFTLLALP
jgi:hypothetical protein